MTTGPEAKAAEIIWREGARFCLNYIYTGKLAGVNETCVLLEDAAIVYETGAFNEKNWKDAQSLPKPVYVMLRCIESFMELK